MAYALAWLTRWGFASISAALALEIFAGADLSFMADPENLIRRTVRIFLGGLEIAVVWILLDNTRHWVVEHLKHLPAGAKMSAKTVRQVLAVLIRQLVVTAVLLLTFGPATRWLADAVLWFFHDLDAAAPDRSVLGWWGPVAAVVIAGFGLSVAVLGGFARIRTSVRAFGWRFPRAMLRMAQMRCFGPPRDFFEFVPVIRSLPTLALSAFVWVDAPHAAAGWFAAAALLAMTTLSTVMAVLPPVWVFFSSSRYFQFEVFRILRFRWSPRNGITLLDRFGTEHAAVYESERRIVERSSPLLATFHRDPTTPRVWSIRTRPQYWENVAFYLIRMCPLIVVDCRGGDSVPVVRELRSILRFGLLHRTIILTETRGDISQLHEILREEGEAEFAARAFTEEDLVGASWDGDRLLLPGGSILAKASR